MRIGYVNVAVTDFARALSFYQDTLGLRLRFADEDFGYASFDAGSVHLAIVRDPDNAGRHTGIGLLVDDLDEAHVRLAARGVRFTQEPERQPWGGYMALIADPDRNVFYLDQVAHD
jgi:predicted enzyme related to lactoylglutathione lyase